MATRWQGPWTRGLFGEKLKVLSLISASGIIVPVWVPFHSEIYIFFGQLGFATLATMRLCLPRIDAALYTRRFFLDRECVTLAIPFWICFPLFSVQQLLFPYTTTVPSL